MQKLFTQLKRGLILAIFFPFVQTYGQNSAVSITSGITEDGYAVLASYNYYLKNDNFVQISTFVSFAEDDYLKDLKIPYNDFTVNAGYYARILKTKNNAVKISLGAGAVFGYESVNQGDRELENGALVKSESGFIFGGFAGLDADIFLSDKISVIGKFNQYYHHNSDIGQFTPYAGFGLRYFFN